MDGGNSSCSTLRACQQTDSRHLDAQHDGGVEMKYRVHRFELRMTRDQHKLEEFLNNLEGEVVAVIPNVTPVPATYVDFVLIVERLFTEKPVP